MVAVTLLAGLHHVSASGEDRSLEEDDRPYGDEYPPEAFDNEQKKDGAIVLYVLGMLYMFLALAIVCDECFVPALEEITNRLELRPDVAGATFMAAGGSAPEFFTSLIGSTIVESDVGIGTIVGSAVFNVLFVIGCCAFVSPRPLELTWWPLARDSTFYTVDLIVLSAFFNDAKIHWWESLILFFLYVFYGVFMTYNERIEAHVYEKGTAAIDAGKRITQRVSMAFGLSKTAPAKALSAAANEPVDDGRWASARSESAAPPPPVQKVVPDQSNGVTVCIDTVEEITEVKKIPHRSSSTPVTSAEKSKAAIAHNCEEVRPVDSTEPAEDEEEEEEESGPLTIEWPKEGGFRACASFFISLPILVALIYTVPDVRREGWAKFYPASFFMSILWIAGFTYLMVWFVTAIAHTLGVPVHILGLTVLAAGTSVPDLLTSAIVAKAGKGDMAVSSSIGSNIFDVTVGLPIPWLLYSAINGGEAVTVTNKALKFSILVLLLMLMTTMLTIKCNNWVMTKSMGLSMFVLYLMFMLQSILVETLLPDGVNIF